MGPSNAARAAPAMAGNDPCKFVEGEDEDKTPVPADLKTRIAKAHKATRTQTWDEVLREIVESDGDGSTA